MELRNSYSNNERYTLISNSQKALVIKEPLGWKEEGITFERNPDYHGVFVKFSGDLGFTSLDKDYIKKIMKIMV